MGASEESIEPFERELGRLAASAAAWCELLGACAPDALALASLEAGSRAAESSGEAATSAALEHGQEARQEALEALRAEALSCTRCGLHRSRTHVVFGEGPAPARLMFVGEGPGAEEDRTGRPFVGRSGELLTRMIAAMGLRREAVYIANVVKCRPPQNRTPSIEEARICGRFLERQIELVDPEVIVALGRSAALWLLGCEAGVSLGSLRGRVHRRGDRLVVATYHPAYLLRTPQAKRAAWQDLQRVMALLGLPPARGAEAAR